MKPRVYVETSVVSYLTTAQSRDIVIAGRQQVTQEWWATAAGRFELVISELVRQEAATGHHDEALFRLAGVAALATVAVSAVTTRLAEALVDAGAVPRPGAQDAVHIAIAAVRQIPFLVTWNLHHIANATARRQIGAVCRASGIDAPVLCTPEQLFTQDAEMKPDPIVAEVRAGRERLAARFDYDIDAIVRHAQKLEAEATRAGALPPQRESAALDAPKERAASEDTQRVGASVEETAGPLGNDDRQ